MKTKIMVRLNGDKLTPKQFRESLGVSEGEFLGTVVERYNNTIVKEEEKAEIVVDLI